MHDWGQKVSAQAQRQELVLKSCKRVRGTQSQDTALALKRVCGSINGISFLIGYCYCLYFACMLVSSPCLLDLIFLEFH